MNRYELQDRQGRAIVIAEAADRVDAELYGYRHVPGFGGGVAELGEAREAGRLTGLEEAGVAAWKRLGLSEEHAREAVESPRADPLRAVPTVRVPHQAPDPRFTSGRTAGTRLGEARRVTPTRRPSTPPQPVSREVELREVTPELRRQGEAAWKTLGLNDEAARAAAEGRDS